MKKLLQDGKQLFLPRVEGKQMEFYRTTDLEHFVRSSYGILEPLPGEPLSKDPALFLIPGCAFDLSGGRIGYGGGYYDRYLAARRSIRDLLFGYAYDFEIMESLPLAPYDIRMQGIITPERGIVICCGPEAAERGADHE